MKKFVDLFWITFGESYEYNTMAEIIAAKSAARNIQRLSGRSGKKETF